MAIRRLQILQAIKSRLDTLINGTAGYYSNVTGKVFLFRETAFQAHETPGMNITRTVNEFGSEKIGPTSGKDNQKLFVDVEFVCTEGASNHEFAEKMVADIYKAIGTDPTWGALAHDTVLISDEVDVDEVSLDGAKTQAVGGGKASFVVHYQTPSWTEG